MPLKVMDLVELRLRVLADLEQGVSVREAAGRHGVGKTQVYEWRARHAADGAAGLVPRSRRPAGSPAQLGADVEDEIVRLRKERPRWGAKKIRAVLARTGWPTPAVSTVHRVLVRRGLIETGSRRRPPPGGWTRFTRAASNELWQIDATQHVLADGSPFWVVDLVDDHSRFLLAARVTPAPTADAAWRAVVGAVAAYGLPAQVLSDNGLCFTGRLHGVTVSFERRLRAAGVGLLHARPYHPETVGKLERQHRTQNEWLADVRLTPATLTAAQAELDAYRTDYNTHRPHEAIGQRTPAEVYRPGAGMQLPAVELDPADSYPDGCQLRHVKDDGSVSWNDRRRHLGERWAGAQVGLIRRRGRLHVYYGSAEIAVILVGDEPDRPPPRPKLPKH